MTEQTPETPDAAAVLPPAFTPNPLEGFLTVEQMLDQARRPQRVAKICLRGDIEAEYLELLDQLGDLVDAEGNLLTDDASITDLSQVTALREAISAKHAEMRANTTSVLMEAMDGDAWEVFEKKHRGPDGSVKDVGAWQTEMISTCAINPQMTADQVKALRKKLGPTSVAELANKAYSANTSGGVDVPKLPNFWHSPKQQEQSLS